MAKKSKTQKAKASAARQARREERVAEEEKQQAAALVQAEPAEAEKPKRTLFKKKEEAPVEVEKKPASYTAPKAVSAEPEKKPKKEWRIVTFFKDVRAEMKRVTWPTRLDVLRWSGVVIVALLFFGVFVALLDNVIITPILFGISGIGG